MKITISLLLLIFLWLFGPRLKAQTISLSVKKVPLETVLKQIQKQSGYTIFYNENLLNKGIKVSLNVKNMDLFSVLGTCFNKQPDLGYSVIGNTIVIMLKKDIQKAQITIATQPALPQQMKLAGVVFNSKGEKLGNANIVVLRTHKGAVSNADGSFNLENVNPDDTLKVSFIGYIDQEVPVSGQSLISIRLQEADNDLDEVVKQAYSTTSQRFSTGNITTIKAAEIEKQPVMNPLLAIQGRVPGLLVTQSNGFASAPVKVDIRGIGNLAQATEPLYIIDGVPLSVLLSSSYGLSQTAFGGTQSVAGGESPLFNINPNDIESISVLTGADATAIYGSRGANGVILISTKKGKIGPTKFDVNLTQGISAVTRYWNMLNTSQYLEMRRQALKNDGITPTAVNAPDLLFWDTTRYTNWQKELFGGTGKNTKFSVGLLGGNEQTLFRINADYNRVTDITTLSGSTQRMTLGLNLEHNTLNRKFSIDLSTNYAFSNINLVPLSYNVSDAPDAPPLFNKQGDPNWAEWNVNGALDIYPFGSSLMRQPDKSDFLSSNLRFNYRPTTGLVFSVNLGYNFSYSNSNYFKPISSQNPFKATTGEAVFNTLFNRGWIIEPQLSYHMLLGKGNMDITIGGTLNNVKTNVTSQVGTGYTDDNLINSINNAQAVLAADQSAIYKYGGALAIIKYNLEDKYIINLNGRRDGSSRFGPGKQFGNFGSAGVAWIASEEKWMKNALPGFIKFIKFKGGVGFLGSDGGVGDYQYLSLWSSVSGLSNNRLPMYNGIQPYQPFNPPNQDFHWASTKNIDAGMEVGMLEGNKIYFQLRYYLNSTSDQLTSNPLPDFTGFTSLYRNLPATIQNKGWEAILTANLISHRNFTWLVNFNISANKNKLASFPGLANSPFARSYTIGRPLNTVYSLHYLGVDPLTGQYAFDDHNHDGVVMGSGTAPGISNPDGYVVTNLDPKYFGGFGTQFSYHNIALSLDFYYVKQTGHNAYTAQYGTLNINAPATVFNDHWTAPGDNAKYPAFSTLYHNSQSLFPFSDGVYSDASFIRLNNVSLYYSLPANWLRKTGLKDCRLYVNAQNVFVITNYKGVDPETQNFGGMPPTKIYTGGITFNF